MWGYTDGHFMENILSFLLLLLKTFFLNVPILIIILMEYPHKIRNTNVCVCVCVPALFVANDLFILA